VVSEENPPDAHAEASGPSGLLEVGSSGSIQHDGALNHSHGSASTSFSEAFTLVRSSGRKVLGDAPPNAMATCICSDTWVHGALALGASVKKSHPRIHSVVFLSQDVSADYHDFLGNVFDGVYVKKAITPHPSVTRKGADCVTLKLWLWQLPYKKVLYMDADMITLTDIAPLFDSYGELSAKLDKGAPMPTSGRGKGQHGWNSGMFVLEPNSKTFDTLVRALHTYKRDPHALTGEQQFLNHMYPPCDGSFPDVEATAGCWSQSIDPLHNVFARDVSLDSIRTCKSIHFSGDWGKSAKPWMRECAQPSDSLSKSLTQRTQSKTTAVAGLAADQRNSDDHQALRMELLKTWYQAFQGVPSVPGREHLLQLECPCTLVGSTFSCP
jgi:hypothetical protein